MTTELVRSVLPLWYAEIAWARELLVRHLKIANPEDVLQSTHRGLRTIDGTTWTVRTHGGGVDISKPKNRGGIDFDFDKPDPDAWRFRIFLRRQINDGNISREAFEPLLHDDVLLQRCLDDALRSGA